MIGRVLGRYFEQDCEFTSKVAIETSIAKFRGVFGTAEMVGGLVSRGSRIFNRRKRRIGGEFV